MGNLVAIVGRPNVGKSTLFNRLLGERYAIEDEKAGVTRDRIYGKTDWNGIQFSFIDTGGYVKESEDIFQQQIEHHVKIAVEEADIILFMVDFKDGYTPLDEDVAQLLRKMKKTTFLVVNKVDSPSDSFILGDFFKAGFEKIFPISALNGYGTGELLDELTKHLKHTSSYEIKSNLPRVAIVGKPNVGKSSLINVLLGEERSIVTPIPGTTRDAVHSIYNKYGHHFILIDTAGIRKKTKIKEDLEYYSMLRSIRAIEQADVCILVVDATMGITHQDLAILRIIEENKKGIIIAVNKWDLVEKDSRTINRFKEYVLYQIAPLYDIPIFFISALKKTRILQLVQAVSQVYHNLHQKIKTSELNRILLPFIELNPPPVYKGKRIKIKYAVQLPTPHIAFAFYCNLPQYIKEPYKKMLEKKLRESFSFTGCIIDLYFREK
ncbi:MAG: ribosome biogenesis GTPase Der [Bacteroidales bacterium]|nr:ribosome biogenesis GTPase Der [Bacteroidales bacterium]